MDKHKKMGIIAEDNSDFDSLRRLIPKIKSDDYIFRRVIAKGCGRFRSKSYQFSKVLYDQGCTNLILIRDADGQNVSKIKREINRAINPCPIASHVIVVAVQEIESWLLADMKAIHKVFSRQNAHPKEIASPENIEKPKEYLAAHVKRNYQKQYLNTIHNAKIAENASISKIQKKCRSFQELVYPAINNVTYALALQ